MTLTENRNLESPWQFFVGQMLVEQGTGRINLYFKLRPSAGSRVIKSLLSDL